MDRTQQTRQLPNGQRLVDAGWYLAGFGMHRDSNLVEVSNYQVALRQLSDIAEIDSVDDLGRPWENTSSVDTPLLSVAHFQHWAVGWVDELMIHSTAPDQLFAAADDMLEQLSHYPLLDEDHYSTLEQAEADTSL